jgi:hypothetical protein
MAARKPQNVVEIDGVKIKVDSAYLKSWDGVRQAVEMQRLASDEEAGNDEKFLAVFNYYNKAIENLEEVVEALGGGSTPIEDVFAICSKALSISSAKN